MKLYMSGISKRMIGEIMYEIKRSTKDDFESIKSFLLDVPAINVVDEDILNNASILFNKNIIHGVVSFEVFYNYALIRYFVFKKNVDELLVKELVKSVEESIKEKEVSYVFSLVNQNDIYDLFTSLGFNEARKEDVFVEETNFEKSKFKDTKLMLKRL